MTHKTLGIDYDRIKAIDWSRVHIAADNRQPFRFPAMSKADVRRRERGNW